MSERHGRGRETSVARVTPPARKSLRSAAPHESSTGRASFGSDQSASGDGKAVDLLAVHADRVVERGRAEAVAPLARGRVDVGARVGQQRTSARVPLEGETVVVAVAAAARKPTRPRVDEEVWAASAARRTRLSEKPATFLGAAPRAPRTRPPPPGRGARASLPRTAGRPFQPLRSKRTAPVDRRERWSRIVRRFRERARARRPRRRRPARVRPASSTRPRTRASARRRSRNRAERAAGPRRRGTARPRGRSRGRAGDTPRNPRCRRRRPRSAEDLLARGAARHARASARLPPVASKAQPTGDEAERVGQEVIPVDLAELEVLRDPEAVLVAAREERLSEKPAASGRAVEQRERPDPAHGAQRDVHRARPVDAVPRDSAAIQGGSRRSNSRRQPRVAPRTQAWPSVVKCCARESSHGHLDVARAVELRVVDVRPERRGHRRPDLKSRCQSISAPRRRRPRAEEVELVRPGSARPAPTRARPPPRNGPA